MTTANQVISNDVAELIKQSKPDFIIHFAGVFGTGDHQKIYKANVLSIAVLLESAREYAPDVVGICLQGVFNSTSNKCEYALEEAIVCNEGAIFNQDTNQCEIIKEDVIISKGFLEENLFILLGLTFVF